MTLPQIMISVMLLVVLGFGQPAGSGQAGADSSKVRADKGKRIFVKHCTGCHGVEGKGDGYTLLGADPANLTSPATKKKSDAALLNTIHEGKSSMPSWNVRLSEQDSRDVLTYIRTLSK
ncbi:MAG TPA: cytochrome c [Nitrospira sp.]|nr:cytochrome c [Nitrospira sp.]